MGTRSGLIGDTHDMIVESDGIYYCKVFCGDRLGPFSTIEALLHVYNGIADTWTAEDIRWEIQRQSE